MRLSIIKTVFGKELREMLRDRRSLLVMFGVPLILYPLLTFALAGAGVKHATQLTEQQALVDVINPDAAPHLMAILQDPKRKIQLVHVPDPEAALKAPTENERIDGILKIPPGAERTLLANQSKQTPAEMPSFQIVVDRSQSLSSAVEGRLSSALQEYQNWVVSQRLAAQGVPESVLTPLQTNVKDVATSEQRLGKLLSLMLPLLLLVTGMLGALFPALNATTTERELGTLETLLVTPAGRFELLVAKGLLVFASGLATALLNEASMSLVLWRTFSLISVPGMGALTISPWNLLLAFLAAAPTILFFSMLVMIVGLLARNFREANSFATPVMLIPLASIAVSILELEPTVGHLITPVIGATVLIREILVGQVIWWHFVLAFVSQLVLAGIMISMATRLFSTEQLVNPSWEPVSLKAFRAQGARRRRLPTIDEALVLFAVSFLLILYISPSFLPATKAGLAAVTGSQVLATVVLVQIPLIAGLALLAGWLMRYAWRATFSWRKAKISAWIGGGLIGLGMVPVVIFIKTLQDQVWPGDASSTWLNSQILVAGVRDWPIVFPIIVAALAGLCEETLYRGPIQAAFVKRKRTARSAAHATPWLGLIIVAILFALAHGDMHNAPIRAGMGLALGWIVYRTGSVLPAMLAHGLVDFTQLVGLSWAVHQHGEAVVMTEVTKVNSVTAGMAGEAAVGLVVLIVGIWMVKKWNQPATEKLDTADQNTAPQVTAAQPESL